jgi:hypothetical protein
MIELNIQVWIAKGLNRGDHHSLIDVASGLRPNGLTRDQAHRLAARRLVRASQNGNFQATVKGRLILLLRQLMRRRSRKRNLVT